MDAVASALPAANPPQALIEVFDAHSRVHARHRLLAPGSTCTIGRSVACDVVLDDPFAAAEHTTLTLLADGRVRIRDLGSRNGTRIERRRLSGEETLEVAAAELIVGRTRVRIRTTHAALAPERVFRRDLLQRHRTQLAVLGLALSGAFAAFTQWIAAPEPLGPRIFLAVVAALGAIGLWAGFWGLISRVSLGAWMLRTHIAIAANTAALCLWFDWTLGAAAFAAQWSWLKWLAACVLALAVLSALYLHLRKATHFSIRTAALIAVIAPFALASAAGWVAHTQGANDVNRMAMNVTVYPPQLRMTASVELDDYLARTRALKREANRARQQSLAERPLAAAE